MKTSVNRYIACMFYEGMPHEIIENESHEIIEPIHEMMNPNLL